MTKATFELQNRISREENKMINDKEKSVEHRWINLSTIKGTSDDDNILCNYSVESFECFDNINLQLIINVSRKFIPVGTT